ncbi:hypothetical protein [Lacibacter sp.]|uniref:hypothetical protein n=1 Tax=Lacibacter sp. TaxID=1915409 RepID=UPI002B4B4E4F|nr:hypothetical protein [Lacibacter sp.]HLP38850.1 hypothetical protein [Lacibacter sp.]
MAELTDDRLKAILLEIKEIVKLKNQCDIRILLAKKRQETKELYADVEDMDTILATLLRTDKYKLMSESELRPYTIMKKHWTEKAWFKDVRSAAISSIMGLAVSLTLWLLTQQELSQKVQKLDQRIDSLNQLLSPKKSDTSKLKASSLPLDTTEAPLKKTDTTKK